MVVKTPDRECVSSVRHSDLATLPHEYAAGFPVPAGVAGLDHQHLALSIREQVSRLSRVLVPDYEQAIAAQRAPDLPGHACKRGITVIVQRAYRRLRRSVFPEAARGTSSAERLAFAVRSSPSFSVPADVAEAVTARVMALPKLGFRAPVQGHDAVSTITVLEKAIEPAFLHVHNPQLIIRSPTDYGRDPSARLGGPILGRLPAVDPQRSIRLRSNT